MEPDIQAVGGSPALAPKDERRPDTPAADILDVFEAPSLHFSTEYTSDEVTALCPITGQPDYYEVEIFLQDTSLLLESKSLKLYLGSYRQTGMFCEALATQICEHVKERTKGEVDVRIKQKARGGVTIKSFSTSISNPEQLPVPTVP